VNDGAVGQVAVDEHEPVLFTEAVRATDLLAELNTSGRTAR